MNYKNYLLRKLPQYNKKSIIITNHAEEQAIFQGIEIKEIKENIINPKRLYFAGKQPTKNEYEEKFDCYFEYSKTRCHRYVVVINNKCIVCTIIKIKRRWQRMVEKYAKI